MSIKIISRGKGKTAVAAAAYRAGEKITSAYDGITHDYTSKGGVVHTEILLPDNAPFEYAGRATLWNAVEQAERNSNAQLAREIELACPVELTAQQNRELVRDYCRKQFVSAGMCADVCLHDKGDGNPHVCAPEINCKCSAIYYYSESNQSGWFQLKDKGGNAMPNIRFVRPNYNRVNEQLTGTISMTFKCPVDVQIAYNGEELNSATSSASTSWGTMSIVGDEKIVAIDYGHSYNIVATGTGAGTMDLEVEFDTNEGQNNRIFLNIPITDRTTVYVYTNAATSGVELYVQDGDEVKIWYANPGETVTDADEDRTREYLEQDIYDGDNNTNDSGNGGGISTPGTSGNGNTSTGSSSRSSGSGSSSSSSSSWAKTRLPDSAFSWDGDRTLTIDHDSITPLGLLSVQWDGVALPRGEDYAVYQGSVIVRFNEDFIAAQSMGGHTVRVDFLNHTGETTVTVGDTGLTNHEPNDDVYDNATHNPNTGGDGGGHTGINDNPNTGDGRSVWTALLLGSISAAALVKLRPRLRVKGE